MELQGQVAIVTGAGRGIGRATALELARLGADIVIAELDAGGADKTAALVKDLGRRAVVVPTDVTKRADLAAMVERTRAAFGRIDVLVNNAGIYRAAAALDVTEEHWDAIMTINAKAVFFATQAVLPVMIAQKSGSIISLASMAGKVGSRTNLPYNVQQGRRHQHDQEPGARPRRRRHSRQLRVPRLRRDRHVEPGRPRAERAAQTRRRKSSPASVRSRCRWGGWNAPKTSPPSSASSPRRAPAT